MKKLTLLWILLFTLQIFGQNNVALKFDEFNYPRNQSYNYYYPYNYDYRYEFKNIFGGEKNRFTDRVIRFAQEVLKQKDSKAYIIFYNQRKGNYLLEKGKTESQEVVRILTNKPEYTWYPNPKYPIPSEMVITIDGGFRETPMLEFYVVPAGVEPPQPTPTLDTRFVVEPKKIVKKRKKVSK